MFRGGKIPKEILDGIRAVDVNSILENDQFGCYIDKITEEMAREADRIIMETVIDHFCAEIKLNTWALNIIAKYLLKTNIAKTRKKTNRALLRIPTKKEFVQAVSECAESSIEWFADKKLSTERDLQKVKVREKGLGYRCDVAYKWVPEEEDK